MGTLYARPEFALDAERGKTQFPGTDSSLSFTVSLNADRRRIFHVLTIPEYMEMWLTVPGRHRDGLVQVTGFPKGFHVRYIDQQGVPTSLAASYQTCRTAKTHFLWRKIGACQETPTSQVKVRLNGDFERTTLCLTHCGLTQEEDRDWHSQLWDKSLRKLSSLFELQ
jgi:hypothetical protein